MAKGTALPFFPHNNASAMVATPAFADSGDGPSSSNNGPSLSPSSSRFPSLSRLDTRASRMSTSSRPVSISAASVAASVRTPNGAPPTSSALVYLKLSGSSFLDVVVKDNITKDPVYIVETERETTTIHRCNALAREPQKVATVTWPQILPKTKSKSGRIVQMANSRPREAEEFLKIGALGNFAARKFNVPHYPSTLKWKLVPGNSYWCTSQGIKGPIAILDAAMLQAPARLRIFQTHLNGDEARSQDNYNGVPLLLLDYLIVTSLLLVTDVQEWLDRPQTEDGRVRIPGSSAPAVRRWLALIHDDGLPPSPTLTAVTSSDERSVVSGYQSHYGGSRFSSDYPPTPSTPGTSVSAFSPRSEDVPPVPPLPPLAFARLSQQSSPPPLPLGQPTGPPPNIPRSVSSATSPTNRPPGRAPRQLPKPPVLQVRSIDSSPEPTRSAENRPTFSNTERRSPSPSPSNTNDSTRTVRARPLRSSLGRPVPPSQPPPQQGLPLPPKLAEEFSSGAQVVRRHSDNAHYTSSPLGQQSTTQPVEAYASGSGTFSPSQETHMQDIVGQMQQMVIQPSSSYLTPTPRPRPSTAGGPQVDAGMIPMTQAQARTSYAESVYEMPPPAYDAIDFSRNQAAAHGPPAVGPR